MSLIHLSNNIPCPLFANSGFLLDLKTMTYQEAAEKLNLSKDKIYSLVKSGCLKTKIIIISGKMGPKQIKEITDESVADTLERQELQKKSPIEWVRAGYI